MLQQKRHVRCYNTKSGYMDSNPDPVKKPAVLLFENQLSLWSSVFSSVKMIKLDNLYSSF